MFKESKSLLISDKMMEEKKKNRPWKHGWYGVTCLVPFIIWRPMEDEGMERNCFEPSYTLKSYDIWTAGSDWQGWEIQIFAQFCEWVSEPQWVVVLSRRERNRDELNILISVVGMSTAVVRLMTHFPNSINIRAPKNMIHSRFYQEPISKIRGTLKKSFLLRYLRKNFTTVFIKL